MATSGKHITIKRLEEDRNGMLEYVHLLLKNIAELKQRLIMTQGALQYINQLLKQEENDGK